MNLPEPSRRHFVKTSALLAGFSLLPLASCSSEDDGSAEAFSTRTPVPSNRQSPPAAAKPVRSVKLSDFGGGPSTKDNAHALGQALQAAGTHGEVVLTEGTHHVTTSITWPNYPVQVRGTGTANTPTVVDFPTSLVTGLSVGGAGIGGSRLTNITFTGTSSAQLLISGAPGQQFVVERCTFTDAPDNAIQTTNAYLFVQDSMFLGRADGKTTAVHGMGAGTKVTARNTTISGCFRGLYCAGVDDLSADSVTVDGMWWSGNPALFGSTLSAVDEHSAELSSEVKNLPASASYTITAWEKVAEKATLSPVAGKPGWYTISGQSSPEARLMLRTEDTWTTVLETAGNQVRLPAFYDWATCHPKSAPTGSMSGVTIERPYIASVLKPSGTKISLQDRWKCGAKALTATPPKGARVTLVPIFDYQIFATDKTKSFSAIGCTVRSSRADSISTIASSNGYIARNTVWDSQDVGVTVQQGSGAYRVEHNTFHRIGTAAVFIGTSKAQVLDNTVFGAQHNALQEDSYGALQVEGAEKVAVWNNTIICGGSPFEIRGLVIEGRYGPFPSTKPAQGPFATDGYYKNNTFRGYPTKLPIPRPSTEPSLEVAEVTVRGKSATAKVGDWGKIRIQALDGAEKSQIKA